MFIIQDHLNDSTKYYDKVEGNIQDFNSQLTKKGIIFEDIKNIMSQIKPLVEDISK